MARFLDAEDFLQQSWVYFLEGIGDSPPGVDPAVWQVGRLAGKLHAWCRTLYRRVTKEVPFPEGFDLDADLTEATENAEAWLDAVGAAEDLCTDDEAVCVYFRFAGYRGSQSQEILGITEDAYRQRLHRLRDRLSGGV